MTDKQRVYYFKLWNKIVNRTPALIAMGAKERDAARQAFNFAATGLASSRDWKHSHFDSFIVLANYAHEEGYEAALQRARFSKGDGDKGERKRLVWRIKKDAEVAGLSPEYIADICDIHIPLFGDMWKDDVWKDIDLKTLKHILWTIRNRAKSKTGMTTAQMDEATAEDIPDENIPF